MVRQTDRLLNGQMDGWTDRLLHLPNNGKTDADRFTNSCVRIQTDRLTERQTGG
jgi:hypothetical protein